MHLSHVRMYMQKYMNLFVCAHSWSLHTVLGKNMSKSWLSRPHPPRPKARQVMRQEVLPLKGATGDDMGKQESLPNTPCIYNDYTGRTV